MNNDEKMAFLRAAEMVQKRAELAKMNASHSGNMGPDFRKFITQIECLEEVAQEIRNVIYQDEEENEYESGSG